MTNILYIRVYMFNAGKTCFEVLPYVFSVTLHILGLLSH